MYICTYKHSPPFWCNLLYKGFSNSNWIKSKNRSKSTSYGLLFVEKYIPGLISSSQPGMKISFWLLPLSCENFINLLAIVDFYLDFTNQVLWFPSKQNKVLTLPGRCWGFSVTYRRKRVNNRGQVHPCSSSWEIFWSWSLATSSRWLCLAGGLYRMSSSFTEEVQCPPFPYHSV